MLNSRLTRDTPLDVPVYSFPIYPESYQPSGTYNYSRIDEVHLDLTFNEPNGNNSYNGMFTFEHTIGGMSYVPPYPSPVNPSPENNTNTTIICFVTLINKFKENNNIKLLIPSMSNLVSIICLFGCSQ